MRNVPRTLPEQLAAGKEIGHEFNVVETVRSLGDPGWIVKCSCGYASKPRRSRSAAMRVMSWHMGVILADYWESPKSANG